MIQALLEGGSCYRYRQQLARMRNAFRYRKTPPQIIRLAMMMYIRFPLSLRNLDEFSMNAVRISPMKQFDCGGTAIGQ